MEISFDLLTPEEVAEYVRVNPQTIYRLLRSGKLPGAKIGHQWRIRKADLDAYLYGRVAPAAASPPAAGVAGN